jgi:uncharacterized protein (DUF433 family)
MERDETLTRIRTDAKTLAGKPTIRDTRVAVEHVLGMMADGATADEILSNYPFLEPEDVQACVAYAWKLVSQEEIEPLRKSTAG